MIDTRNKRASCLGVGAPGRVCYASPTGASLDTFGGKQAAMYLYSGIPVDSSLTDEPCFFMPQTMGAATEADVFAVDASAVSKDFCWTFAGF